MARCYAIVNVTRLIYPPHHSGGHGTNFHTTVIYGCKSNLRWHLQKQNYAPTHISSMPMNITSRQWYYKAGYFSPIDVKPMLMHIIGNQNKVSFYIIQNIHLPLKFSLKCVLFWSHATWHCICQPARWLVWQKILTDHKGARDCFVCHSYMCNRFFDMTQPANPGI